MIVIVEGVDRVGKTTLCRKLEKVGFVYFKDFWNLGEHIESKETGLYSLGKLDTTITLLRNFKERGINVVVDRCHLTEWVYSRYARQQVPRADLLNKIDAMFAQLECILVFVRPENIERSNLEAGIDLARHETMFHMLVKSTQIPNIYETSYSHLDVTLVKILQDTYKYDLYVASPFFTPEQVEREEAIKAILRQQGFNIFSPKENCFVPPDADVNWQSSVFQQNCDAIKQSMAVFAITDQKDMGTIWEAGYAYGINRPVIYFAETLGGRGFNLMLAQSGKKVYMDRNEITRIEIMQRIFGEKDSFKGLIE